MDHYFWLCLKVKNTLKKKKTTKTPSAFLKTESKSIEMLFYTNEVKTALTPPALPKLELSERLFLKFRKRSSTLHDHHKLC